MKKKYRVLILLAVFCMMFSMKVNAASTVSKTLYAGTSPNNTHCYSFTVNKRCIIKFSLKVGASGPSSIPVVRAGLNPWPYNGVMLFAGFRSKSYVQYYALKPGRYELRVGKYNYQSTYYNISYSLRIEVAKQEIGSNIIGNAYENVTMFRGQTAGCPAFNTKARKFSIGKRLCGAEGAYYKFVLSSNKKVRFQCKKAYGRTAYCNLYNSAGRLLRSFSGGKITKTYSLKKGTYYIYLSGANMKTSYV